MPRASNSDSLRVAIAVIVLKLLLIKMGRHCWSWIDVRKVFRLLDSVYAKGGRGDAGYDDCCGTAFIFVLFFGNWMHSTSLSICCSSLSGSDTC
jgi:hypothetical protein